MEFVHVMAYLVDADAGTQVEGERQRSTAVLADRCLDGLAKFTQLSRCESSPAEVRIVGPMWAAEIERCRLVPGSLRIQLVVRVEDGDK